MSLRTALCRTLIVSAILGSIGSIGRAQPGPEPDATATVAPDATAAAAPAQQGEGVPLLVGGWEVYRMRAPLGPFPVEDRAAAASKRLHVLVTANTFDPGLLKVEEFEGQIRIAYGDQGLFTVLPQDFLAEEPVDPRAAAARIARELKAAIDLDRRARAPGRLALSTLLGLLIVGAMAALSWGGIRAARWSIGRVAALRGTILRGIRIHDLELVSADTLVSASQTVIRVARAGALLLLFYIAVSAVLALFPWSRPKVDASALFVIAAVVSVIRGIFGFIPNLFMIVLTVIVIRYINRFIGFIFDAVERGVLRIPGFHPELAPATKQLSRWLVWILGMVVIFPYLPGSDSPAFRGIGVFVGLMVSLGSSGAIGNLVSGIVLTYSRSFSVGDRVRIADTTGDVVYSGLLSTKIVTIKNEEVTIPNAAILGNHIVNYTELAEGQGLILHTSVTIGYDAPWRTVHTLLIEAAIATRGILPQPEPFVLQKSLDDFYVSYEINAYTRDPRSMARIYSELHQNIQDRFNAAGVEIMSPHFASLRDGNHVAIPPDQRPEGYRAGAFHVRIADPKLQERG